LREDAGENDSYLLPFASKALTLSRMARKNARARGFSAAKVMQATSVGGHSLIFDRIERKRGKAATVQFVAASGNHFFDPNTAISKMVRDQMKQDSLMGPVIRIEARIGEIANLPDPEEQRRSCAAILAKKYQDRSQRLRNLYNAMHRRILSEEECADVFRIVANFGGWNGNTEGTGPAEEQPFEEDDAGAGGGEWEPVGVGGGCPGPHTDEPGELDGEPDPECDAGLAVGEEEDSCL